MFSGSPCSYVVWDDGGHVEHHTNASHIVNVYEGKVELPVVFFEFGRRVRFV
jgi:hypothetical protein